MICSGWDPYLGAQIYKVNSSGFIESCDIAMSGSGSIFIQSYADTNYKPGFTKAEAERFLLAAVSLAIYRDSSSGGCIRLMDITKDGTQRKYIPNGDLVIR